MKRCTRCHRLRETSPWLTPGGLLLGVLCERCRGGLAKRQAETERALELREPSPRMPRTRRVWQRHHPTARRIAAAMLADPALLALRSRTLRADAQARYGVGECEAKVAISLARAASRAVNSAPHETSEAR